jgi:hypothetical protein
VSGCGQGPLKRYWNQLTPEPGCRSFGSAQPGPDDLKHLTWKDGQFDIAKSGGEDPILTAIHRVDFR